MLTYRSKLRITRMFTFASDGLGFRQECPKSFAKLVRSSRLVAAKLLGFIAFVVPTI